jgi:hypothetical protein
VGNIKKEASEIAENALKFALENFPEDKLLSRVREVWLEVKE